MAASTMWPDIRNVATHQFPQHLLQQTTLDDFVAVFAVFLCSLAYITKGALWDRADPFQHKLFEKPPQRAGAAQLVQRISDLEERLTVEDCNIAVCWGSQSGTAERLAGRLAKELQKNFGTKVLSIDISDIDPTSLTKVSSSRMVIIMASTFGEGDPSDNLHQMWSWLREPRSNTLSKLRFLAFGLGNSNYKHYNHVINVLEEGLLACGAQQLLSTGKADDATGDTEEHFLEWKQRVFDLLKDSLGYEQQEIRYEPSIEIVEDASLPLSKVWSGDPHIGKAPPAQSKVFPLPITRSYDLLSDSPDRKCLHIELDISQNPTLKYKTGDHLAVWPINPASEVKLLLRALDLEEKRATPIHIQSLDSSTVHVPSPTTLEAALQSYLEVCAAVPRESVQALSNFAPTKAAEDFLKGISHDKDSYAAYSKCRYVNLGRLLEAACNTPGAWSSMPLSFMLELLPAMQPRFYSVSSSSVVCPRQISITVAVSDTTTPEAPDRIIGLATNYLSAARDGHHPNGLTYSQVLANGHIYAAIRKSTFKLPLASQTPVVMVGAGTGVAPFRAFVQERARLKSMGRVIGNMRLFFGCRNAAQDLLYGKDFSRWADELDGSFTMTTAFSRPSDGNEKRYVQDAMMEDSEALCKLLVDDNAYFYICGSAAMARDVSAAVAKMIQEGRSWNADSMKDFADRQKRTKRWLQDVWG